jgi:hypothetical protein
MIKLLSRGSAPVSERCPQPIREVVSQANVAQNVITQHPPGGPITFAVNNSMNEVYATRALAFARECPEIGGHAALTRRSF